MSADEMFEELGYVKDEGYNFIRYLSKDKTWRTRRIRFWTDDKVIFNDLLEGDKIISSVQISMQELKAINKKCEELGWLDECNK